MAAGENTNILQSEKEVLLFPLWGTMLQRHRSICWVLLDPAAFLPHDLWSPCPWLPPTSIPNKPRVWQLNPYHNCQATAERWAVELVPNWHKHQSKLFFSPELLGMDHLSMSIQVAQKWATDSVAGALPSCASALTQQGFDFFAWQRLSQANPIPHLSNTHFSPTDISLFNCCSILLIKALGKFYTC